MDDLLTELDRRLAAADAALAADYRGDRGVRQPIHTVYVPADRFDVRTVGDWGAQARAALDEYGGSAADLAKVLDLPAEFADDVYDRVRAKLEREPIEDLRIDFEDGYGNRPDDEEDAAAIAAAQVNPGTPFHGLRIKSLEAPTRRRAVRTLELFLKEATITDGFVITLPKVTSVEQVEAMVLVLETLEQRYGVPRLKFEIQVETPQAILGADGTALIARMVKAGGDRVTGLHYGTYDYSASLGVAAAYQSMEHPVADHAKDVMQLAAAGTGVFVSDGSTNVLPVGDAVHDAWRLHFRLVRRSLTRAIYQGWDMHPAQLPTRFAATYLFYREGFDQAARRLRAYLGDGESGYLDEPATAAALAAFVLRGIECGAIDTTEFDTTGLAKLARRAVPED
ncbi:HpcH/HpaI aldolase/citrate lyase family protein [Kribbella rubisoli]|uniref:HpcH/HpaI aldolase/citrate lyase family protein n=1 Tax=Kribbella rubisoli TaxID=3075929 RepID=A0A4Q7WSV5_9ACTN|nr:aldolase/citrate lyase family protein [Kribbella rubisoli]RZU13484.1 HpcH/HpaI aldolase/citrate lyase family protein [Kribbella rubisoli]